MSVNVALWEPDIRPPLEWLIPSVLYQEKISTVAPHADKLDRDGRERYELEQQLGELYVPLSLSKFLYPPTDLEALLALLRSRLPVWSRWVEHRAARTGDNYGRLWLERSAGWPERRARLTASVRVATAAVGTAHEDAERSAERLRTLDAEVTSLSAEVAGLRSALQPELAREKADRKAAYEDALRRRSALITPGGRWGRDPATDSEIRMIDAELQVIRWTLDSPLGSPERQNLDRVCAKLAATAAARKAARQQLRTDNRKLAAARRRRNEARRVHDVPWRQDSSKERWLTPQSLIREVPASLETMGRGKVYGEVFEFLATEAGMWVSQSKPGHYEGTLVGPREVVDDVISILAEWYCGTHDGWVSMSTETDPRKNVQPGLRTPEELVTLGVCWLLPTPADATLADACSFRRSHEEELRLVREAISTAIPELATIEDLREAVRDIEIKISEPLSAIERALKLERSVTFRKTKQTVLHHAGSGLRNLIASVAASGIALPVLGSTLSAAGILATVGGGAALTLTGLVGHQLYTRIALARSQKALESGPYKYLYDVGERFGFAARVQDSKYLP